MREKFSIEVVLTTQLEACGLTKQIEGGFKVYINPNACRHDGFRIKNILAHELGHVIAIETHHRAAKEFKTKGWLKSLSKYANNKKFRMLIEEQAWDIARFIADRNKSLKWHRDLE